jgi:hypothetical protein
MRLELKISAEHALHNGGTKFYQIYKIGLFVLDKALLVNPLTSDRVEVSVVNWGKKIKIGRHTGKNGQTKVESDLGFSLANQKKNEKKGRGYSNWETAPKLQSLTGELSDDDASQVISMLMTRARDLVKPSRYEELGKQFGELLRDNERVGVLWLALDKSKSLQPEFRTAFVDAIKGDPSSGISMSESTVAVRRNVAKKQDMVSSVELQEWGSW